MSKGLLRQEVTIQVLQEVIGIQDLQAEVALLVEV